MASATTRATFLDVFTMAGIVALPHLTQQCVPLDAHQVGFTMDFAIRLVTISTATTTAGTVRQQVAPLRAHQVGFMTDFVTRFATTTIAIMMEAIAHQQATHRFAQLLRRCTVPERPNIAAPITTAELLFVVILKTAVFAVAREIVPTLACVARLRTQSCAAEQQWTLSIVAQKLQVEVQQFVATIRVLVPVTESTADQQVTFWKRWIRKWDQLQETKSWILKETLLAMKTISEATPKATMDHRVKACRRTKYHKMDHRVWFC